MNHGNLLELKIGNVPIRNLDAPTCYPIGVYCFSVSDCLPIGARHCNPPTLRLRTVWKYGFAHLFTIRDILEAAHQRLRFEAEPGVYWRRTREGEWILGHE